MKWNERKMKATRNGESLHLSKHLSKRRRNRNFLFFFHILEHLLTPHHFLGTSTSYRQQSGINICPYHLDFTPVNCIPPQENFHDPWQMGHCLPKNRLENWNCIPYCVGRSSAMESLSNAQRLLKVLPRWFPNSSFKWYYHNGNIVMVLSAIPLRDVQ